MSASIPLILPDYKAITEALTQIVLAFVFLGGAGYGIYSGWKRRRARERDERDAAQKKIDEEVERRTKEIRSESDNWRGLYESEHARRESIEIKLAEMTTANAECEEQQKRIEKFNLRLQGEVDHMDARVGELETLLRRLQKEGGSGGN